MRFGLVVPVFSAARCLRSPTVSSPRSIECGGKRNRYVALTCLSSKTSGSGPLVPVCCSPCRDDDGGSTVTSFPYTCSTVECSLSVELVSIQFAPCREDTAPMQWARFAVHKSWRDLRGRIHRSTLDEPFSHEFQILLWS